MEKRGRKGSHHESGGAGRAHEHTRGVPAFPQPARHCARFDTPYPDGGWRRPRTVPYGREGGGGVPGVRPDPSSRIRTFLPTPARAFGFGPAWRRGFLKGIEAKLLDDGKEVGGRTRRSTGRSQAAGTRAVGLSPRNRCAPALASSSTGTRGSSAIGFHGSGGDAAARRVAQQFLGAQGEVNQIARFTSGGPSNLSG